jgi:hypothetical protein
VVREEVHVEVARLKGLELVRWFGMAQSAVITWMISGGDPYIFKNAGPVFLLDEFIKVKCMQKYFHCVVTLLGSESELSSRITVHPAPSLQTCDLRTCSQVQKVREHDVDHFHPVSHPVLERYLQILPSPACV